MTNIKRPGDLFIDRYMPGASAEERERAHERLRAVVAVLIEIDERMKRERIAEIRQKLGGAVESEGSV